MTNKVRTSTRSFFLVILLIALLFLQVMHFDCGNNNRDGFVYDPELPEKKINDSLPYYSWKRLKDSSESLEFFYKSNQTGSGSSTQLGPVGYGKYSTCDTCSSPSSDKESVRTTSYYFILDGYRLEYNSIFSVVNGKSMLKYPVWDSTHNGTKIGHYAKKELKIRFKDDPFKKIESSLDKPGNVLVPVSKTTYTILSVLFTVLCFAGILFTIYVLVFLPFVTMVAIATGTIFTKRNIKNLLFMGWSFIAAFFAFPLIGLLFMMIFSSIIPKEIHFPFWESLLSNKSLLIAGVILLLLANAFKSGYKLKQEQDLTV